MKMEWEIKIVDVGYKLERDIYIFREIGNRRFELLGVGEFDSGKIPAKPTLSLNHDQLQKLADALNDKGFKPKEGFLEGKLNATEKHLEDMRKLVFKNKS